MWLVVFSSKFLFLWLDDYIFGSHVELGGLIEIIVLSAVLMASEKVTKILWDKIGQGDHLEQNRDEDDDDDDDEQSSPGDGELRDSI